MYWPRKIYTVLFNEKNAKNKKLLIGFFNVNLIKQVFRVHNRNTTILKLIWVNKYNWKILGRNTLYGTTTSTFIPNNEG